MRCVHSPPSVHQGAPLFPLLLRAAPAGVFTLCPPPRFPEPPRFLSFIVQTGQKGAFCSFLARWLLECSTFPILLPLFPPVQRTSVEYVSEKSGMSPHYSLPLKNRAFGGICVGKFGMWTPSTYTTSGMLIDAILPVRRVKRPIRRVCTFRFRSSFRVLLAQSPLKRCLFCQVRDTGLRGSEAILRRNFYSTQERD